MTNPELIQIPEDQLTQELASKYLREYGAEDGIYVWSHALENGGYVNTICVPYGKSLETFLGCNILKLEGIGIGDKHQNGGTDGPTFYNFETQKPAFNIPSIPKK